MRASEEQNSRTLVPPLFQIILIGITTFFLAGIFYNRIGSFTPRDPLPTMEIITPQKNREFGAFAREIKVGLFIDEYENFNLDDNNFIFTGEIWFCFDPGIISLDTLEKFSFTFGTILFRSPARESIINNQLFIRYSIRVQHSSTLNLKDFPLDNHHIYIYLENQYISPAEIIFTANLNHFIVHSNSEIFGWVQRDTSVRTGYIADKLDPFDTKKTSLYPSTLFIINYIRISLQQAITILLPLLLIFFVIVLCFSIKEPPTSISLAAGSVTGILAYKFVIANISPKVGYFMLSDYIFFLFLAECLLIFFFNIFDIYYRKVPLLIKKGFLLGVHIILNVSITYFITR